MIKLAADLHIHSCLSPCGDMDMTPNNIVNMSYLKGLEAIAICDHNCARNLPAVKAVADARGLLLLPGLEVETREEVHVLTFFETVDAALVFGEWIYTHLPNLPNMPDFFGEQIVMNAADEPIDTELRMLAQPTTLPLSDIVERCRNMGGTPVPAHINRTSNSLLYHLGFMPPDMKFTSLEVYPHIPARDVFLEHYHILYNSDAHTLEQICEASHFISAYDRSTAGILAWLNEKK